MIPIAIFSIKLDRKLRLLHKQIEIMKRKKRSNPAPPVGLL